MITIVQGLFIRHRVLTVASEVSPASVDVVGGSGLDRCLSSVTASPPVCDTVRVIIGAKVHRGKHLVRAADGCEFQR